MCKIFKSQNINMKKSFLLPQRWFWIGLTMLIPFFILGIFCLYQEFQFSWLEYPTSSKDLFTGNQNFTDEVAFTGTIISLLMMCFSSTHHEDEFIRSLRLQSWQWAILVHFLILLLCIWLIYGGGFYYFLVYNALTIPIIFLLRFRFLLWRQQLVKEEMISA